MSARASLLLCCLAASFSVLAQPGLPGEGPWIFGNFEEKDLRVSVLARGLGQPWDLVFLPGEAQSSALLSEAGAARLRLFRNGNLAADPVLDLKAHWPAERLLSLALHPRFADNGQVYFSWTRTAPQARDRHIVGLARARWDGTRLVDPEQLFAAETPGRVADSAAPLRFLPDGSLLFGIPQGGSLAEARRLDSYSGKVLRLNDDGSPASGTPFAATPGALPGIHAIGVGAVLDFALHPQNGAVWELEVDLLGGDEVNILQPGADHGWPLEALGEAPDRRTTSGLPWVEGSVRPEVAWRPSIMAASMLFYTGEAFPAWRNNLFVSARQLGGVPGTGHLQRVVFNELGEARREFVLTELRQPLRRIAQAPDGLLWLLTDGSNGALLLVEPVPAAVLSAAPDASDLNGEAVFAASDCAACHRSDAVFVGPSYMAIAGRYEASPDNIELLMGKIIQGGYGTWGEVPMNAHGDLAPAVVREMVERILALDD